jgi:hypothetical protein
MNAPGGAYGSAMEIEDLRGGARVDRIAIGVETDL